MLSNASSLIDHQPDKPTQDSMMSTQEPRHQALPPRPIPSSPQELVTRFPYQFAEWDFSFAMGWFPIFAQLCVDIDGILGPDKLGFHWVEHKEKFGRPCWIPAYRKGKKPEDDETRLIVRNLIEASRSKAGRACIVCGRASKEYLSGEDQWMLQLCEGHGVPYSTQGGDALPTFYFSD